MNYYNDSDQSAQRWLEGLIVRGLIPPGTVSGYDIRDVDATRLHQYRQVHLFAGIGGWSRALQLAGWPDSCPVWTGSCPCQPFSNAGHGEAENDPRHLWPQMFRLIEQCRPPTIFGEQVASKAGLKWLGRVFAGLESIGYSVAGADLCAAGVGAPHIRRRLYWLADSNSVGPVLLHHLRDGASPQGYSEEWGEAERGSNQSFWSSSVPIRDGDGRMRRIEPSSFPLAYGVPERMGRLRGYGNSIVPQLAAEFIKAYVETKS